MMGPVNLYKASQDPEKVQTLPDPRAITCAMAAPHHCLAITIHSAQLGD